MSKKRVCPFCQKKVNKEEELLLAKSIGEENAANRGWHVECYRKAPCVSKFNKDTHTSRIYYCLCKSCNHKFINTQGNLRNCPGCGAKHNNIYHHKCENCGYEEDNNAPQNRWTCGKCGWSEPRFFKFKCGSCGYEMTSSTPPNRVTCPNCGEPPTQTIKHVCPDCGYTEVNKIPYINWTCPKCNYHYAYLHHCDNCGYEERSTTPAINWICPKCDSMKVIESECKMCGHKQNRVNGHWICKNCGYTNGSNQDYQILDCNGFKWNILDIQNKYGKTKEDIENGWYPEDYESCTCCGSILIPDENGKRISLCCKNCQNKTVISPNGFKYNLYQLIENKISIEDIESGKLILSKEICANIFCNNILIPDENGEPTSRYCSDDCRKHLITSPNGFKHTEKSILKAGFTIDDIRSGASIMPTEICANSDCTNILTPDKNGKRHSKYCSPACRQTCSNSLLDTRLLELLNSNHSWPAEIHSLSTQLDILQPISSLKDCKTLLRNNPGKSFVWCKVDGDTGDILDVMAINDISKEWKLIQSWLADPSSYATNSGKYHHLSKIQNLQFRLVCICDTFNEALIKEALFACYTNADSNWWRPAPGQSNLVDYIKYS